MLAPTALLLLLATSTASFVSATEHIDYRTLKTAHGDNIPDFSFCGYQSSNAPIPAVPAKEYLIPAAGKDQTSTIQQLLDKIGQAGGGALKLEAGTYEISSGLSIPAGTVLRGAGAGKTILVTKDGADDTISMGSTKRLDTHTIRTVSIEDKYVPVGATAVTVSSVEGLKVGQHVFVQRAVTEKWVAANGMNNLFRHGKQETWLAVGDVVYQPRKIASIDGHSVRLDIPLTDQLDAEYMQPQLVAYDPPSESFSGMGLEYLSMVLTPTCSGRKITENACKGRAINFRPWATNSWVRHVSITGYNFAIIASKDSSQITVEAVSVHRNGVTDGSSGYASDMQVAGSQILIIDSASYGDSSAKAFAVSTLSLTPGPNAIVRHYAEQDDFLIQPHMRWAHGLLIDNSTAPLSLVDRGIDGSGHGWTINSAIGWNNGGTWQVQSPPLGTNWCVGCRGHKAQPSNGTFVSAYSYVTPASLFDQQLLDRTGK